MRLITRDKSELIAALQACALDAGSNEILHYVTNTLFRFPALVEKEDYVYNKKGERIWDKYRHTWATELLTIEMLAMRRSARIAKTIKSINSAPAYLWESKARTKRSKDYAN